MKSLLSHRLSMDGINDICLLVQGEQNHSLKELLPLHHSQREIYACDDYADFELTLRPTYDFYMKLMSFGNMIKVLEPESLQEKIYKWLEKTIEVYK